MPAAYPRVDFAGRYRLDSGRYGSWSKPGCWGEAGIVVGGGFVGIELAENLHERGLEVTWWNYFIMPCLNGRALVGGNATGGRGMGVGLAGVKN